MTSWNLVTGYRLPISHFQLPVTDFSFCILKKNRMGGIDRLLPIADKANKLAQEEKQIYIFICCLK